MNNWKIVDITERPFNAGSTLVCNDDLSQLHHRLAKDICKAMPETHFIVFRKPILHILTEKIVQNLHYNFDNFDNFENNQLHE